MNGSWATIVEVSCFHLGGSWLEGNLGCRPGQTGFAVPDSRIPVSLPTPSSKDQVEHGLCTLLGIPSLVCASLVCGCHCVEF